MSDKRLFYTVAFNVDNVPDGFDPESLEGFLANIVAHGIAEYKDQVRPMGTVLLSDLSPNEVNVSFDIERAPYKPQ